ncbi:MAG: hypothetical protein JRC93_13135 [Deltaproteobacteria bacterium]|nr:hypothetical protein [Deltaproteobacteria bacterium]MBW2596884.1 hypothetical protein [Deltaproteobacteria bacterium]
MIIAGCNIVCDDRRIKSVILDFQELSLKTGTLVTRDEEEEINVGGGKIEVVPVWRFLLNLPE